MPILKEVRGKELTKYGAKRAHYENRVLERNALAVLAIRSRYPKIYTPEQVAEARRMVDLAQEPRLLKQAILDTQEAQRRLRKLERNLGPEIQKYQKKFRVAVG